MPMKLRSSLPDDGDNTILHSIPAQIDYNGEANVHQYFQIKPTKTGEAGKFKASYRGRPLLGKKIEIPPSYKGYIANKKRDTFSDHQEQTLYVEKSFDSFTLWNLETPPTSNDVLVKSLDWLEVANVLHSPVYIDEEKENNGCDENVVPQDEKPVLS